MKEKKTVAIILIGLISVMFVLAVWSGREKQQVQERTSESLVWMPKELKVELLSEPYGINSHNPAFSWYVNGTENKVYQKCYQIVISKSMDEMKRGDYLIDTGWCESSENTYVKIGGIKEKLEDNSIYYWKVKLMDLNGVESEYSDVQCFSTGVGDEWKSLEGIWNGERSWYVFLRTEFGKGEKEIEKALLSATALSPEETRQYVFNIYINGKYVGSGPSRINGGKINYNTYDVTEILEEKNSLGAICYSNTEQAFLCQLTVFYEDGTKEILVNSGSDKDEWRVLNGDDAYGRNETMISTPYYVANAENINASAYPEGWLEVGYDDSTWQIPQCLTVLNADELYAYETENMEKYYVMPASIRYKGGGHYIVDFGKEIIGGIAIESYDWNSSSTELTIRYGEELDRYGNVKYQMRTANIYEEKWKVDDTKKFYENIGMKTFRYVDVHTDNILYVPKAIKGVALRQAFDDEKSSFDSSSKLLSEIYNLTKYTIKATNQNLYVDSQSRERGAYEGDVWINMLASYAFEDRYTLARVSNEYLLEERTWPAEYPLYAVMCAWEDYMYTGNLDSLVENYENLKGNMSGLIIDDEYGLIKNDYGEDGFNRPLVDWPETERDGYAYDEAEYNTVVNAIACHAYEKMAQIASVVGEEDDAEQFEELAQSIKYAMILWLYDEERGAFSDGLTSDGMRIEHYAQHATAYALYANIYTDVNMRDELVKFLEESGKIKMSVFGSYFLLQGLYNNDAGTYATQLLTADTWGDSHTWAHMLKKNKATITTEAWSVEEKDNMTFSHPWGASPAALITQGMFGIVPTKAGFDEFQIKLQPGTIRTASIKTPTIKGEIQVSYKMNLNQEIEEIQLVVPSNTRAIMLLPQKNVKTDKIRINNKTVEMEQREAHYAISIEAGTYTMQID